MKIMLATIGDDVIFKYISLYKYELFFNQNIKR